MTTVARYVIDPHKGAGPFRFGMARSVVGPTMGVEARTIDRRPNGGSLVDIFFEQGVQILYDPNERIGAIQFTSRQFTKLGEVLYPPDVRTNVPYSRFVKWVQKQDPAATFESERFRSDALGIAGGSRSDKSHKFLDHLLVYPPRYYDDSSP
jgi:hypothetical protein